MNNLKIYKVTDETWDNPYDICHAIIVCASSPEEAQQLAIEKTVHDGNHEVFVTGDGLLIEEVPLKCGIIYAHHN